MIDRRNIIKRCRVALSYPDTARYPNVQVEYNGKVKDVEVIMPYGLSARIPVDALGHKFVLNGDEGDQAGIFNTPPGRFKHDAPGEVAVGNPKTRSVVYFRADGSIHIDAQGPVTIDGPGPVTINSPVVINGGLIVDGIVFGSHTHSGVTVGVGDTGGPQ